MRYETVIILAIAIIVVLLLFLFFIRMLTRSLVGLATDREPIKFLIPSKKISIRGWDDNFINHLNNKADILEARKTEHVEIIGQDGIRLVGHILPSYSPKRIILAFHGWRGSWSRDFGIISDFWCSTDSTVIYIEQRGQRQSGGEYITFGILERYDVVEWVRLASLRFDNLPIYLCGVSMGATSVLLSSSLGLSDRVHGIIADSGFTSAKDIWSYVINKNLHLPYFICRRSADIECKKRIGYTADCCSTLNSLSNCHIPILFIHGEKDSFVPAEMTYLNYNGCASPKRLFIVPDADHCMGYYLDPDGYENEIKEFFRLYD